MTVVRREVKVEERIIGQITTYSGGIIPLDMTTHFENLGGARPLLKYGVSGQGFSPRQLRDIADFMEASNG